MRPRYSALSVYDMKEVCESCLSNYKQFKMKYNKTKVKCIVNDSRSVVFYTRTGLPVRLLYQDIKRIEMRSWMKLVFVLSNREIVISGFRRKSMFNHLKKCMQNQMIVVG